MTDFRSIGIILLQPAVAMLFGFAGIALGIALRNFHCTA
jgi:hypothetical protein